MKTDTSKGLGLSRGVTRWMLVSVLSAVATSLLLAQGLTGGSRHQTYDLKQPLPVDLPQAYALAVTRVGAATNYLYCISATCRDKDSNRSAGWTFEFASTNGNRGAIKVFFNKDVWIVPETAAVFK